MSANRATPSLAALRRYAVRRTLFRPTSLARAIEQLGFVQADPIRAPARAQDLILRHRVAGYRAGDLERAYPRLAIEEDAFVNYGYLPRAISASMHPRTPRHPLPPEREAQALEVLAFIAERGAVHPREVDEHFQHGRVTNWFGGTSNASTQLLDHLHYRGALRVAARSGGTRTYALAARAEQPEPTPGEGFDALLDVAVGLYAPLPLASLRQLASYLGYGAPQWRAERAAALARARARYAWASVAGLDWCWPADEDPSSRRWAVRPQVRLLAPFDPIVWDRLRFKQFWGWEYRFEAYTPAAKRVRGYYALPLLWRDQVIGWGNLSVVAGRLRAAVGYLGSAPTAPGYAAALDAELDRLRVFLGVE